MWEKLKKSLTIELNLVEKPKMPDSGKLDKYPSDTKRWSNEGTEKEEGAWKQGLF